MWLLATVHPAAPLRVPGGSLAAWVWLGVALAAVVTVGLLIASRR